MRINRPFFLVGCVFLLVTALGGCGRGHGPTRIVVAGTVTYEGKPVGQGQIRFVPVKGSTGPVSVAEVVDGKYRADAKGGVPVATQRVEIYAYRPDPKFDAAHVRRPPSVGASSDWPPKEQYLPAKYNDRSELELIVETGHGEVRRDFELPK